MCFTRNNIRALSIFGDNVDNNDNYIDPSLKGNIKTVIDTLTDS